MEPTITIGKTNFRLIDVKNYKLYGWDVLTERESKILFCRIEQGMTLKQVGQAFHYGGISPERVRQIEAKAFAKLYMYPKMLEDRRAKETRIFEQRIKQLVFEAIDDLQKSGIVIRPEEEEIGISSLQLSRRTINALINNDINTLRDILNMTYYELRNCRGLGKKAFDEIIASLADVFSTDVTLDKIAVWPAITIKEALGT